MFYYSEQSYDDPKVENILDKIQSGTRKFSMDHQEIYPIGYDDCGDDGMIAIYFTLIKGFDFDIGEYYGEDVLSITISDSRISDKVLERGIIRDLNILSSFKEDEE